MFVGTLDTEVWVKKKSGKGTINFQASVVLSALFGAFDISCGVFFLSKRLKDEKSFLGGLLPLTPLILSIEI